MDAKRKLISIVTPCYNEEDNVTACYEAVRRLFQQQLPDYDYEHVFCDNASTDGTVRLLRQLAAQDRRVKVIINARNFGPFRSTFNGLLSTGGDAVVVMLAVDLQDPPELIPEFVKKWQEGHEVVFGIRKKRQEFVLLRWARRVYYRLVSRFANIHIPPDVGEFQLIDRVVVDALRQFDDYYPYIRGMIANCGFRAVGIEYTWKARKKGVSKNRLYQLVDQGLNGFVSFTNIPLRLCMFAGFFIAACSLLYAFYSLIVNLIYFRELAAHGVATVIVAVFFFSGLQLFFFGILGEYICAIHFQVRKRPLVIERERINFAPEPPRAVAPS
jgi:glycosyltransferase involved in cell wall biosynthesis